MGEVIRKDDDLFGHDVNLCSRIESIAFSGAIACCENVYNETSDLYYRCYGYVDLKNINTPKKIYKLYTILYDDFEL